MTAVDEIVSGYLPWLVRKQGKSAWLLLPAAFSFAQFAWLLTLHPTATRRSYATNGGIYRSGASWLYVVDGIALARWDVVGAAIALVGMVVIALQPATGA